MVNTDHNATGSSPYSVLHLARQPIEAGKMQHTISSSDQAARLTTDIDRSSGAQSRCLNDVGGTAHRPKIKYQIEARSRQIKYLWLSSRVRGVVVLLVGSQIGHHCLLRILEAAIRALFGPRRFSLIVTFDSRPALLSSSIYAFSESVNQDLF